MSASPEQFKFVESSRCRGNNDSVDPYKIKLGKNGALFTFKVSCNAHSVANEMLAVSI